MATKKPKSVTILWTNSYEHAGSFSKDLYLFLEHIEYEPNELSKEWIEQALTERGIKIKYFDYIVSYCTENRLIDVRKRKTGTLSIKINAKGIAELRELRSKRILEKQNKLLESQSMTNRLIAFGTIVIALSAATGPFTKPTALTVLFTLGAMLVYDLLHLHIKKWFAFLLSLLKKRTC